MTDQAALVPRARSFSRTAGAILRADVTSSFTERTFTFISMMLPLNYLVFLIIVVSSGARAPIAVVMVDRGPHAQALLTSLYQARSFNVRVTTAADAQRRLEDGTVVGIVTMPASLDQEIASGRRVSLPVTINNLDVDFTDDIRRAIPLSITTFSARSFPSEVALKAAETDLRQGEPSYLQYISVSSVLIAIMLSAMLPAGTLAARQHEKGTFKTLVLSPANRLAIQGGHIAAGFVMSSLSVMLSLAITLAITRVLPAHPGEMVVGAMVLMVLFVALGNLAGNFLKRRPAVTPLCAGLAVPLFVLGGAFIPISFTHPVVADVAHLSPTYYGLAVLQHAFYGVNATPQSFAMNLGVLVVASAAIIALGTRYVLRYQVDH